MPRVGRRALVVVTLVVAGGVLAGGVIAAQRGGGAADVEELQAAIEAAPVTKVVDIAASDGHAARGVFVQELETGHVCVWDAPSAMSPQRGGGCNAADDPLGGSAVSASLAYDGGPGIEKVRDARLIGLADPEVASVVVLMTDGSERGVRLKKARLAAGDFFAFGYRFSKADLRGGVGPIAVIARSADGEELARQPTGIG